MGLSCSYSVLVKSKRKLWHRNTQDSAIWLSVRPRHRCHTMSTARLIPANSKSIYEYKSLDTGSSLSKCEDNETFPFQAGRTGPIIFEHVSNLRPRCKTRTETRVQFPPICVVELSLSGQTVRDLSSCPLAIRLSNHRSDPYIRCYDRIYDDIIGTIGGSELFIPIAEQLNLSPWNHELPSEGQL
jgi:hypothetical protein